MKASAIFLGSTFLIFALPCAAQSPDAAAGTPSSAAKPAAPANSSTQSAPAKPTTASTPGAQNSASTETRKPKKVWTNDEVGSMKGGVSVVGDGESTNSSPRRSGENENSDYAREEQIQNYRGRIQQLKEQIDDADKRIEQLKHFKGENTGPSGAINMNQGYNMVPLEDQVKQLEDRKKKLRAKIDDVEVEARKNGIEPGELR